MLRFVFLICCFGAISLSAQRSFSYISDRRFQDISDLLGYQIVPNEIEIKDVRKEKFAAGSYAFGITRTNLYVSGKDIAGVYNINNINPTEFGYQLLLMNARDPTLTGHLKIFLNGNREIDAIIFKRSPKDKEMVFYLPELPDGLREYEAGYFTDRGEQKFAVSDSLWGKSVHPAVRLNRTRTSQERLMVEDSTTVTFTEKVRIIEKKKKDKNAPIDTISVASSDTTAINAATSNAEKDVKIIREYYVEVRSILHFTDGRVENKVWKYEIDKTSMKENSSGVEDRYSYVFKTKKGAELVLGLDRNKAATFFDFEDQRLWMRGF